MCYLINIIEIVEKICSGSNGEAFRIHQICNKYLPVVGSKRKFFRFYELDVVICSNLFKR